MEVSTKELRIQPGKIIDQVVNGEEVTVTFRGKPLARIVPVKGEKAKVNEEEEIFGMWKSHASDLTIDQEVRLMREGRTF